MNAQIRGKECTNYADKGSNLFLKFLILLKRHVEKRVLFFWRVSSSFGGFRIWWTCPNRTVGSISHVSGPKLIFWRYFLICLHGFAARNPKNKIFQSKTLYLYKKRTWTEQIHKEFGSNSERAQILDPVGSDTSFVHKWGSKSETFEPGI